MAAILRVGDPTLGEWEEWSGYAYHVRRRLTPIELQAVGPVVDVRGTSESKARLAAVARWLPKDYTE